MRDLKSCRVLVTPRSYAQHDPRLRSELERTVGEVVYNPHGRALAAAEVRKLIAGCDGYIAGLDTIDRSVIEAADRLRVIARYGVGVDNVDLAAARERGIVVTNTPGANAISVAELTVGLMLALARMIPLANQHVRAGRSPHVQGVSLQGKTVGLLGLGAVGRQVARRLQGFECTVLACDPALDSQQALEWGVGLCPLEAVAERSDFLSLHLPLTDETRRIVNAALLARMKPGVFIVNTARGELIDEDALAEALQSGHVRGVGLDVLSQEPPPLDHPLLAFGQVIVTGHTGAHTDGATNAMGWSALEACLAVLRGEQPLHRVV